jgi:RNA polymerase sigma-70 factor, ECF subfamily
MREPDAGVAEAPAESEVQELVRRAQEGKRAAATALYRLHVRRVFRTVRPLCSSAAEAEEVVQDAFVKAFTRGALERYRPRSGARFISWLLTIALNTARKRARSAARRFVPTAQEELERLGDRGLERDDADLDQARAAQERVLVVALAELEPRDREVLTLRYAAGLSASEVGELCGLGEANVRKLCQRRREQVLRRVRELIDDATRTEGNDRQGVADVAALDGHGLEGER